MKRYKSLIEGPDMSDSGLTNGHAGDSGNVQSIPHFEIVSRVSRLPVVESAISYAGDSYGRVKNGGPASIQRSVSWAETLFAKVINLVLMATLPFVQKFEGPMHSLDSLACTTFDKMTQKLPLITQPPEEIVTSTRSFATWAMEPFQSKLDALFTLTTDISNRVMQNSIVHSAWDAVKKMAAKVNQTFDQLVPPTAEEVEAGDCPDLRTKVWWIFKRFSALTKSVQSRYESATRISEEKTASSGSSETDSKEQKQPAEAPGEKLRMKVTPEKPLNIFLALVIGMADLVRKPLGLEFQSVPDSQDKLTNGTASKPKTNGSLLPPRNSDGGKSGTSGLEH